MNIIPSEIKFCGYRVKKAVFSSDYVQPTTEKEYELNPVFIREIQQKENGQYILNLGVKICSGDKEDALPFNIEVMIEGIFLLENVEDALKAMKINAVAILFPYLRATLSLLTTMMNINPVTLPTINLVAMFEKDEEENEGIKN